MKINTQNMAAAVSLVILNGFVATALSGCASMSNRTKTILTMSGVGLAAGTIGALTAPEEENPLAHGMLWSASGAAAAGVVSLFLYDSEARFAEVEAKNKKIAVELASYKKQFEPQLISEEALSMNGARIGGGGAGGKLQGRLHGIVSPGSVKVYKLDQWIDEGENVLIHQDQKIELVPPSLLPLQGVGAAVVGSTTEEKK